ncbi:MAG: aminopeptidase P family protein, partial [Gemmatimonadota bacterium]
MFESSVYQDRRRDLASRLEGGLVLLPGHGESPINYADNPYRFRQDSTFLYYFGLWRQDVAGVLDVDAGRAILFGDDPTVAQIVWTGEVPTMGELAERVGVTDTRPRAALGEVVGQARAAGRPIHWLAPYRPAHTLLLMDLLGHSRQEVEAGASEALIKAIVDQRSYKSDEEVAELERAVTTSVAMHRAALRMVRPGTTELAIAAEVERVAREAGGRVAFPVIATINGQTLHNHGQPNTLQAGELFLLDAGAETAMGYAGDLTTTCPVDPEPSERQRDVYEILLRSYEAAVAELAPGIPYRDVHLTAARVIFDGMKELGLMRGDTEEAVAAGAHALVFPHGLGHMMGLDVHDMENLGEQFVGYGDMERSTQFGLSALRLARPLEPGFVFTVEPGIYFIPKLIDDWRERGHLAEFIDYDAFRDWRGFGGMRNEEDYLVTDDGARRLGPRKPQTAE